MSRQDILQEQGPALFLLWPRPLQNVVWKVSMLIECCQGFEPAQGLVVPAVQAGEERLLSLSWRVY
jgi:hypothetical protein